LPLSTALGRCWRGLAVAQSAAHPPRLSVSAQSWRGKPGLRLTVSKTVGRRKAARGFESHPLRCTDRKPARWAGLRCLPGGGRPELTSAWPRQHPQIARLRCWSATRPIARRSR